MDVTYTIVNISPKKSFSSVEDLKKYCETHVVPDANYACYPTDKFVIKKTVSEEFTIDGMEVDTSIDKNLCIDLINKVADMYDKKRYAHIDVCYDITPFNSFYRDGKTAAIFQNWIINYLRGIKEDDIKEVIEVHTDYKPCNSFAIHINNHVHDPWDSEDPIIVKYNKNHGTKYKSLDTLPIHHSVINKVCGDSPLTVDFSSFTEEEREYYDEVVSRRSIYIQFRDDDIMIDTHYCTGRHVNHRQNVPSNFDKKRYDWCMEKVNGNFKKKHK